MATRIYCEKMDLVVEYSNPGINIWTILWDEQKEEKGISYMAEFFTEKPTIAKIKDTILNWYNEKINQEIMSGFTWKDIPVWLSIENQFNYKSAYDLAIQTNGQLLPTFKFGTTESPVYYKFESLEDLKDFYISAMTYVTKTLSKGWQEKDGIDWTVYENLLK